MPADPKGVKSGAFFIDGDHACAEGAIAAGCRFVAGYPITPSTEAVERIAERFPLIGGMFIQMEDEIASSIAIQGAVWAGKKAMTVTSGPGFSLMMEHIGLAAMTETPCVFVDVQRAGPSTGLTTLPAQGDIIRSPGPGLPWVPLPGPRCRSGAVIHRSANDGQSQRDVHSTFKIQKA